MPWPGRFIGSAPAERFDAAGLRPYVHGRSTANCLICGLAYRRIFGVRTIDVRSTRGEVDFVAYCNFLRRNRLRVQANEASGWQPFCAHLNGCRPVPDASGDAPICSLT